MEKLSITLTPQRDQYRPYAESPSEMVRAIQPEGKDIINIAAYGGYSLWLLAENPSRIHSVDISEEAICVSRLQQILITSFSFSENLSFMSNSASESKLEKLAERSGFTSDYLAHYFRKVCEDPRMPLKYFPQLKSEQQFTNIRQAILQNKWSVSKTELIDFLDRQEPESVDIIYASTVRNWTLKQYLDKYDSSDKETKLLQFIKEFDLKLARAAHKTLKQGGRFIDVIPLHETGLPRIPIDFRFWQNFKKPDYQFNEVWYSIAIKN